MDKILIGLFVFMEDIAVIGFRSDVSGLKNAEKSLDSLAKKGEHSEKRINKSVSNTNKSFNTLKATIGAAGLALAGLATSRAVSEITNYADAWKQVSNQLKLIAKDENDLIKIRQKVIDISKETRAELEATSQLYFEISRSSQELGKSQEEVAGIVTTLNKSFLVGGRSAQAVAGAITQLNQALGNGVLQAQEFNSIADGAPIILDALAKKLGVTRGQVKGLVNDQKVSSKILIESIQGYSTEIDKMASKIDGTYSQSIENASTNIKKFVGENETLNSVVNSLGSGIEDFTENLDAFVDGTKAVAVVVGVAVTPALVGYTTSVYKNITAQLLANTTAIKTVNAYGQVATSAASATVATNALGMASRFLLGPWGLLITAVGVGAATFISSKNSVDEMTGAITDMNKEVEKSTDFYQKYLELTSKSANSGLQAMSQSGLQDAFDKSTKLIEIYTKRLDELKKSQASFARISDLETKLELQKLRLEEINKLLPNASTSYAKMSKAVKSLVESLDPSVKKQRELEENTNLLTDAHKKGVISLEEYNRLMFILNSSHDDSLDSFGQMVLSLENQRQELSMTSDEFEIYSLRMSAMANNIAPDMIEKLVEMTKANQALRKEIEKTEQAEKDAATQAEEFARANDESANRIDSAFSDVWLNIINGSGNVFDSVIDGFKRMLAEMIHLAVTKPIVLQIGTALGLGGMSSAANAGGLIGAIGGSGVLGDVASLTGVIGGLSSGIIGLGTSIASLGGIAGSFGAGMAMTGAGLSTVGLGGTMSAIGGLFGGGQIAAGIGASLPIAAIAAAAAGIVDKISGGGLFGTSFKEKDRTLNLGFGSEGAFGSTLIKEKKKRSLFRGSKTRFTENDLDLSVIGDMFQSVQDSILDAAKLLDITTVTKTTTNFIRDFEADFKRSFETVTSTTETSVEDFINNFSSSFSKSIKGMSEEEVQAEIANWANKTTEQMVTAVFGGLAEEFAKEGESSLQTIDRLIMNMQVFNQVTDTLGLDFGLIGEAAAKAATNVVEMVGGLDSLNQLTTQYFNAFYDQSEQFDFLTSSLNASFEELGQTMPATRDQFRALVDGLDLTTEAGQEMFAALMQLVPGMDAFFDSVENEYTNALNSAMSALKESVALEKDRAKEILNNARLAYDAEVSRINAQRDAVLAQESSAQQGLDLAKNALDVSFEAQRNAIQDATNERISGLNAEISLLSGRKSSLSSVANDMRSLSQSLANAAGLVNDDIGAALARARRGDFSAAKGLSGQLPSASGFSSATEFKAAQALAKNQLAQISGLAGTRATDAERQISVLEGISGYLSHQISQAQAENQEQLKALDDQYNSILGIDNTVLSLNDAITQYQEAKLQLDSLQTDSMLEALDNELAAANALLELAQQTYEDEISRLDDVILNAQAQLDALYGIDTSIMSVTDAINNLNDIIANPPEPTTTTEPVVDPAKKEFDDNVLAQNEEIRQNTKITNRLLQQMVGGGLDVRVEP